MKSILFLTTLLFTLPLHATPRLVVEASLTEKHADGSTDEWKARPITVADGKPALFHLGGLELKVTPASLGEGRMVVPMLLTRGSRQNVKLLAQPTVTTRAGQVIKVGTDHLTFSVVVTLAR